MQIVMQTKAEIDQAAEAAAHETERTLILAEFDALDRRSARALRAVVAGTATDEDKAKLAEIETEATTLRARLAEMEIGTIG